MNVVALSPVASMLIGKPRTVSLRVLLPLTNPSSDALKSSSPLSDTENVKQLFEAGTHIE